ncbi:MAG: hypothetical protein AB7I30_20285, partial [Isosphaeraceae bacterium]
MFGDDADFAARSRLNADEATDDETLDRIVAEYLGAVEGGREPDRERLLRDHPDQAAALSSFFAGYDAMRRLAIAATGDECEPTLPRDAVAETRYEAVRFHDEGGVGQIFLAYDARLRRPVALKTVRREYQGSDDHEARFLREAEITGALAHPGVVPIYGIGRDERGRLFYAMPLIAGGSLARAIVSFHEADEAGEDPGARRLRFRELL